MRELLFFPENLNDPLKWAAFNQDEQLVLFDPIKRSDFHAHKSLKKKSVTVVLPGQQVASYYFAMPKVSGQAKEQAIAYALEGICSQSLDDIYVIPGAYVDGKQSAMIVAKQYLDDVLAFIKMHQLKVTSIRVDYMLLAFPQAKQWSVTEIGNDVLWRTDYGTGGRVEKTLWPFVLQQVFEQQHIELKSLLWNLYAPNQQPLPLPASIADRCEQKIEQASSWISLTALQNPTPYQFNIGSQKLNRLFNKNKRASKRIIWLLIVAIFIGVILQAGFTTFVHIKLHKEQALMKKWLTPMGYGNLSLGEVKDRLMRAIDAAEKMQTEDNFLYILGPVSKALTDVDINAIEQIDYKHHQGVAMQFPKDKVNAIAALLKAKLPALQIKVIPLKKNNKTNSQFILINKVGV